MNYDTFLNVLKEYVNDIKAQARVLYQDEKTISHVEKLIDQKYDHTKRVVDYVVDLSRKLNMHVNFEKIAIEGGLFHDIGRFRQGLYHRTYNDSMAFPRGGNHGEYGYELITTRPKEIRLFDDLVEDKEKPVVGETVLYHQRTELPNDYNYHITDEIRASDPSKILTGSRAFNDYEKIILSALLHMVRDADRIDIMYQRSIGEIPALRDFFTLVNDGDISTMAKRWGVPEALIRKYNDDKRLATDDHIIIPRESIPIEKLFVSNELKEKIKNFETIELRTLQRTKDFTPIVALWWTIYTFLKDMNFVGNLKQVEERKILEQIYSIYPVEYQPVIDEIFIFAKETLIDEQLANSKDSIYVSRKR